MDILRGFLLGESVDLNDVKAYVEAKLNEAADWRAREWERLRARQERVRGLNNQLLRLVDQTK